MGRAIVSVGRAMVVMLLAVSIPLLAHSTPADAAAISVQVAAVTQTVTNAAASGPVAASTVTAVTASCPAGTRLVGGGSQTAPFSSPSLRPVGSYPSDASGSTATATDPDSWTAHGESGGQANVSNTTTAFAVCST